ncbi:HrpE/YscL family type III secretion apparatus protein [Paraburkholderia sp. BR10879]|uniref:HrpE/YscL family type III secretion apparatus protein n=1 Tax=Paraburkholderia sp. BR10879 TaxID=3236990 RepID=UPI0034D112FE
MLIKRKPLTQAARAEALMREAKHRAQELVHSALDEAEACRQQAARDGHTAGFLMMSEQLADYVARSTHLQVALREQVIREVRASLQQFIGEPEFLQRLAEAFANGKRGCVDMPVRVFVPNHAKRIASSVRERLARSHPNVEVSCRDIDAFTIEWGEEIMRFNSFEVAQRLSAAALASCVSAADAMNHTALARKVLSNALGRLSSNGADDMAHSGTHEDKFDDPEHHVRDRPSTLAAEKQDGG